MKIFELNEYFKKLSNAENESVKNDIRQKYDEYLSTLTLAEQQKAKVIYYNYLQNQAKTHLHDLQVFKEISGLEMTY